MSEWFTWTFHGHEHCSGGLVKLREIYVDTKKEAKLTVVFYRGGRRDYIYTWIGSDKTHKSFSSFLAEGIETGRIRNSDEISRLIDGSDVT